MNSKRPDTTQETDHEQVSSALLRVLDLGIPGEAPRRDDSLATSVFARLADCMP
jgi:hypothetical protein